MRCAVHGVRRQGHLKGAFEKVTHRPRLPHAWLRIVGFCPSALTKTASTSDRWFPCSHPLVSHGAFVREREAKISNTSGRIRDATLSLHVLARHNNNIGGSLHHPAPPQRRRNFLLPRPGRMVIESHCGRRARTVSVNSMCGCFLSGVKQF